MTSRLEHRVNRDAELVLADRQDVGLDAGLLGELLRHFLLRGEPIGQVLDRPDGQRGAASPPPESPPPLLQPAATRASAASSVVVRVPLRMPVPRFPTCDDPCIGPRVWGRLRPSHGRRVVPTTDLDTGKACHPAQRTDSIGLPAQAPRDRSDGTGTEAGYEGRSRAGEWP